MTSNYGWLSGLTKYFFLSLSNPIVYIEITRLGFFCLFFRAISSALYFFAFDLGYCNGSVILFWMWTICSKQSAGQQRLCPALLPLNPWESETFTAPWFSRILNSKVVQITVPLSQPTATGSNLQQKTLEFLYPPCLPSKKLINLAEQFSQAELVLSPTAPGRRTGQRWLSHTYLVSRIPPGAACADLIFSYREVNSFLELMMHQLSIAIVFSKLKTLRKRTAVPVF